MSGVDTNHLTQSTFPLPKHFSSLSDYSKSLHGFISSPFLQSLLHNHPNHVAIHGPPAEWEDWWDWATTVTDKEALNSLVSASNSENISVPESIRALFETLPTLCLQRPAFSPTSILTHLPKGQSVKKTHEVDVFSRVIADIAHHMQAQRVVDIGAGQGYLSRALASPPHSLSVLALDSSTVQTNGATHWSKGLGTASNLCHSTHHISASTLPAIIQDWLDSSTFVDSSDRKDFDGNVILVGLHACGSLTIEALRAFINNLRSCRKHADVGWTAKACAIVGCCYNLLSDSDTHLSSVYRPLLPPSAFQLAAQPPLLSMSASMELSLRKISFRALLGRLLRSYSLDIPPDARVGRLKDNAYQSWEVYVETALPRLGVDPATLAKPSIWTEEYSRIASSLSVLHILRARLGPVIESWILLDRYIWLVEELAMAAPGADNQADGEKLADVRLEWLFDSTLSARSAAFILQAVSLKKSM